MREIKFDFVCRNIHFNEREHVILTLDDLIDRSHTPSWIWTDNCEVIARRQFTGLKDKNGKEIYEGDIVLNHLNGVHYNIKWNYLHVSFALFHGDNMKSEIICDWINDDESTPNQWECKHYEVIGNVHEHPNLLVA